MQVVVLGELGDPRPRDPDLERAIAVLERPLEIALVPAHPVALRQQGERRTLELAGPALGHELHGARADLDRLLGLLGPERRVPAREQRLDLVPAVELREQLGQLTAGAGVVLELLQRQARSNRIRAAILVGLGRARARA